MRDAHDRLDDVHARIEVLELLRLVGRAEHVRVGAVGLLAAHRVRQADAREVVAHLGATAELGDEARVQPRLVNLELGIGEDAVAIEALDVVALVRAAVAEDVHVVGVHRAHDRGRSHRAAQRRGVEVLLARGRQMERATLQRDDALARHRFAAIDQARAHRAMAQRDRRDVGRVLLIGLREVRGIRIDLHAVAAHPRYGGARIETT